MKRGSKQAVDERDRFMLERFMVDNATMTANNPYYSVDSDQYSYITNFNSDGSEVDSIVTIPSYLFRIDSDADQLDVETSGDTTYLNFRTWIEIRQSFSCYTYVQVGIGYGPSENIGKEK